MKRPCNEKGINGATWVKPSDEIISQIQKMYDDGIGGRKKIAKVLSIPESMIAALIRHKLVNFWRTKSEMLSLAGKKRTHSEETKNKISVIRKKFLEENPDKIPYKINHKSRGETYPEKYFREWLEKENIPFQQEYRFKLYAFDFLINGRVDLEIDGDQHKLDEKIIAHDIKRDDKSKDAGFVVYRIMWSDYQKLNQEEKSKFLLELKSFLLDESNPIPQFVIKKKQPKLSKIKQEDPRKKQALEMLKRGMNYCEVGREFKVSDNAIRKWMKSLGENPKDYSKRKK
jgi:very-short-patch-repair endonuclease